MPRTITEGSVDLDKFPASRVRQLVKKLESSKATVHHIKQVTVTCKWPKSIFCGAREQNFQLLDTTKREDQLTSRGKHTTRLLKTKWQVR